MVNDKADDDEIDPDDKIMVLDFGENQINAAIITVSSSYKLSKLHHVDCLTAGESDVDEEFLKLLEQLLLKSSSY